MTRKCRVLKLVNHKSYEKGIISDLETYVLLTKGPLNHCVNSSTFLHIFQKQETGWLDFVALFYSTF